MKQNTSYNRNVKVIHYYPVKGYAYPNQKTRRYYMDKFVDCALTVITSAGVITALLFLTML